MRRLHRVRVEEAARCRGHRDAVAVEERAHLVASDAVHQPLVAEQVVDLGLAAERHVHAEQCAGLDAGDGQGGLAERLAGDGAGVDRGPADDRVALDDRDLLAEQAAVSAAATPPGPAPITIRSYCSGGAAWRDSGVWGGYGRAEHDTPPVAGRVCYDFFTSRGGGATRAASGTGWGEPHSKTSPTRPAPPGAAWQASGGRSPMEDPTAGQAGPCTAPGLEVVLLLPVRLLQPA